MASPTLPSALNTERAKPYALGLFRIVTGFLFACHGAASLFGWFGGAAGTGGTIETGAWPNWYAAAIQLVGGLLIMAGLFTRSAAFLSSGSMAYAYFDVHQSGALLPLQNGGENAAMFSWVFLLLVFTGPGALALDQLLGGRTATAAAPEATAAATPAGTAR
ncbi:MULTISPECIES: DoxX family protein [unclassified Streptomyces]|uniref:DoxX family protein n=1 Tax=Streptomyces sp. NBC_00060 TaxID=2975636 RepID=A0AAU2H2U3_9ACTN